ncbi:alanine racemase [Candidatus Sulfidibacterium hydrothermale]|uniref:alanine racemase n=1 Tax=Candidatus Sulfidibacterium hydrothermale TaxID=2875962 RepID=UPI001F0A196F|nr:alanine racemase [Candidatus Sulfidibacterium hydrothermale]UBM63288.1 alanine racemase [Candidatus Sulfidibacterium hydrothermale]
MKIKQPTLLVDVEKVRQNIRKMKQKADISGVVFRPHFKTHQSKRVGELFREAGVDKITVSSVSMAMEFAGNGWNDITIAFPLNWREWEEINDLAKRVKLNVLVESAFVAEILARKATAPLGVFIKIDTGYHRTGILPDHYLEIESVFSVLETSSLLSFKGFLTHAGHTYHARSQDEIMEIKEQAAGSLQKLKARYEARFPDLILSYGDTPSCSIADDCSAFDEIRPGNFVYYDVMQYHLGACRLDEVAVAAACPVVALHPDRSEMVIYGGAVHLSKEFIAADKGFRLYGYVAKPDEHFRWQKPIAGAYVSDLSQEHGIIRLPEKSLKSFRPGDWVAIFPVHSCLTANLLKNNTVFV